MHLHATPQAPSRLCTDKDPLFKFGAVLLEYLHPKIISSKYSCVKDESSERPGSTSNLSVTVQTPLRHVYSRA